MKYKLQAYSIYEFGKRVDAQGQPHQEDSMYPAHGALSASDRLFVLCDGMGGHDAGEVASATVCEAMARSVANSVADAEALFTDDMLQKAVASAFDALDGKDTGAAKKMGTTMTFLKLHAGGATIAHMGDSRVYHIRPGKTADDTQIMFRTEDHSLVNDLLKVQAITPEEARVSPQKNIITRAMQPHMDRRPKADVYHTTDIRPGDYFYMCSDGMLEQMEDDNLRFNFSAMTGDDENKVHVLTEATRFNRDNHTAFIIHILDVEGEPERMPEPAVTAAEQGAAAVGQAATAAVGQTATAAGQAAAPTAAGAKVTASAAPANTSDDAFEVEAEDGDVPPVAPTPEASMPADAPRRPEQSTSVPPASPKSNAQPATGRVQGAPIGSRGTNNGIGNGGGKRRGGKVIYLVGIALALVALILFVLFPKKNSKPSKAEPSVIEIRDNDGGDRTPTRRTGGKRQSSSAGRTTAPSKTTGSATENAQTTTGTPATTQPANGSHANGEGQTPQTNPSKVEGQGTHSLPGKIVPPKIGGSHGQSNGHGTQAQPNKEGEQDSHNRPDKNGKTDGGTGHGTHSGKTEEHIVSM